MDYDTPLFAPEIMEGRWLEKGDTNAIVGVAKEIGSASIYLERAGFEILVPAGARRASVLIATVPRQGSMRMVYNDLDEYLTHSKVPIVQSESKTNRYNVLTSHFTTTPVILFNRGNHGGVCRWIRFGIHHEPTGGGANKGNRHYEIHRSL